MTAAQDMNGYVYVGTSDKGLIIFPSDLSSRAPLSRPPFSSNNITCLDTLPDGDILCASYPDNIYRINPATHSAMPLDNSCKNKWLTAIDVEISSDGRTLWIGTYDNSLLKYDIPSRRLEHITSFKSRDIVAIMEDNDRNIWVTSSYGMYKLDRNSKHISQYISGKGIAGEQYHEKAVYKRNDGTIFFGGNSGLQEVVPANLSACVMPSTIYLTQIVPLLKEFEPDDPIQNLDLAYIRKISLEHDNNALNLGFSSLSYGDPVEYAFKMEGFDKDWIYSGSYPHAVYSNLPSGNFRFMVKSLSKGKWSEPIQLLEIHVKEPIWLHPVAKVAYLVILLGLVILSIRLYIRFKLEKDRLALAEKKVEDERSLTRKKINFFNNISHELRSPLTLICGPVKQLLNNFKSMSDHQIHNTLSYIDTNVERLLHLTTQILNFREISEEALPLKVSSNEVKPQIESLVSLYNIYAAEKGISIEFISSLGSNSEVVYDADKLEKIVNNLLFNAVKYTPDHGHITIRLELTRHPECIPDPKDILYIELTVTDDGIGIEDIETHNMFSRFFRTLKGSTKEKGFGIGLHYVKEIVSLHHGAIVGRPNAVKGMSFIVDLPADSSAYSESEFAKSGDGVDINPSAGETPVYDGIQESPQNENEQHKKRILIVEDKNDLLDFIGTVFKDDFEVCLAENGMEGYAKAQEMIPDIVISDIMMPLMDGIEMLDKIKNTPETSHIPVVILTAKNHDTDKISAFHTGAELYLSKPFNPEVLHSAVQSILTNIEIRKKEMVSVAGTEKDIEQVSVSLSPLDKKFLEKLYAYLDANMSDPAMNVNTIGRELGFSRSNFYRKIKALTGKTPNELVSIYRLNRAAELLRKREFTIGEVSDMTGFGTQSHFSSFFKRHFNMTPSEYMNHPIGIEQP